MDKTTLVERDFKDGEKLIKELDEAHLNVHSALWLFNSENDNWRLIIASKNVDFQTPKRVYSEIKRVLKRMENTGDKIDISLQNISVVSPNYPLIKILGIAIRTDPNSISGIRFSRNSINNVYIEDAYIYRIQ
ncbi:hypothetical protein [Bacillus sp. 03113]|uniref:hypothetical protein n=1 Tax=Bacillus sp. 03113 TaxID=2578211 RepID=UPI00114213C5|nr:hypothetical protein [Bacillus sp. 03113]